MNKTEAIEALCRIGDELQDLGGNGAFVDACAEVISWLRKELSNCVVMISSNGGASWQMTKKGTRAECEAYIREFPGAGHLILIEYCYGSTRFWDPEDMTDAR